MSLNCAADVIELGVSSPFCPAHCQRGRECSVNVYWMKEWMEKEEGEGKGREGKGRKGGGREGGKEVSQWKNTSCEVADTTHLFSKKYHSFVNQGGSVTRSHHLESLSVNINHYPTPTLRPNAHTTYFHWFSSEIYQVNFCWRKDKAIIKETNKIFPWTNQKP